MFIQIKRSLAVATLALLAACGGRTAVDESAQPAPDAPVTVAVHNNAFNDVDIYAVGPSGTVDWVGMVTGNSSATLTLRSLAYTAGPLRLLARPIGGRGLARTDPLLVHPGATVDFTVQNNLRLSTAVVR
ncbi:MAG TPA: hypothetical protein VFQ38_12810 [Longimicrobiales bacterium]|nr:hypothetical protein [Longimicrobiales bacterium]